MISILSSKQDPDAGTVIGVTAVASTSDGIEVYEFEADGKVETEPNAYSGAIEAGLAYAGGPYQGDEIEILEVYGNPDSGTWWTEQVGTLPVEAVFPE